MHNILRDYIKLIIEVAKSPENSGDSMALAEITQFSEKYYILYDTHLLTDILFKNRSFGGFPLNIEEIAKHIVGHVKIKLPIGNLCWNAAEVMLAAAEKGYGPMMYDIAMADNPALMSDRNEVSPSAKKVWSYYASNRTDVKKRKFDNIYNPKTPPREDDCNLIYDPNSPELNYAYSMKNSNKSLKSPLIAKHNVFMSQLTDKDNNMAQDVFEHTLTLAASKFFSTKYYG